MSPRTRNVLAGACVLLAVCTALYALLGLPTLVPPGPGTSTRPSPPAGSPAPQAPTPAPEPAAPRTYRRDVPAPTPGLLPPPRGFREPPPQFTAPTNDAGLKNLADRIAPSIVCLTGDAAAEDAARSGCVLDSAGLVLTGGPPMASSTTFVSLHGGGTMAAPRPVAAPSDADWLILALPHAPDRPPVRLSRAPAPVEGAELFAVGCSPGLGVDVARGSAALAPDRPGRFRLVVNAPAQLDPGGPVFDVTGRVCGVVFGPAAGEPGTWEVASTAQVADALRTVAPDSSALRLTAADHIRAGIGAATPQDAMEDFRRALAAEPQSILAAYDLGVAASRLPATEGVAVAAYRKVIELDPQFADAYFNLALLSLTRGETPEALQFMKSVTVLQPDNSEAWAALGELYRRRGRMEEANAALERALAGDDASAIALYDLGVVSAQGDRDLARAVAAFARFVERFPEHPKAVDAERYLAAVQEPATPPDG